MNDFTCSTCVHWDQGGSPLAAEVRAAEPLSSFGICRFNPPQIVVSSATDWKPVAMQPETHASGHCSLWMDEDGGDGPDDGETVVPFQRKAA